MSGFRQPEQPREQMVLWPHRLEDALPADHPVRHVAYLLNSEAFAETFAAWERHYVLREGKPPYHPWYLAGLYLYGMMNRIRSSRQLEAACYNRIDVIWLMEGQHPDHATIAGFVKKHEASLRQLFRDVLKVGIRAGLVKLDHVAVDGTKIEADAGRGSVRRESKIERWLSHLDEQVAALESEWTENESRESSLFGEEAPWAPSAKGSDRTRLAALKKKRALLEQALQEIGRRRDESVSRKPPKAIASTTDPDCRSMKDKEGRSKPNYNAQVAVDVETSMIVATDVNDEPDDSGQLVPMVERTTANCEQSPRQVSADSAYNTGPDLATLEEQTITTYVPDSGKNSEAQLSGEPLDAATQAVEASRAGQTLTALQWQALPKDSKGRVTKAAFTYDAASDEYRCPAGEQLIHVATSRDRKKWGEAIRRKYGPGKGNPVCMGCPHASMCCENPVRGRTVTRDQYEDHRERQRARMASDVGRAVYRRRRETVEPRIGEIKQVYGFRRFLRRGRELVRTEWSLVCTAVNVAILLRHWEKVAATL